MQIILKNTVLYKSNINYKNENENTLKNKRHDLKVRLNF